VPSNISAVIFDFDGVLADTERLHLRAIQDALADYGHTLDDRVYFDRYLGYGDRDVLVEFARDRNWSIDDATIAAFMSTKSRRYRHHLASGSALYPTADTCVRCLAERFVLGIASGSLRAEILHILEPTGLGPSFRAIVGADDVTSGKPAPEPYRRAAELLGVEPSRAVAIEDSRWGLESARAAGMRTIGVTTTYPASALSMADRVVSSIGDVTVELIEELGSSRP
jgi:HAD superfamily hydrolase (TIGR01509 family)